MNDREKGLLILGGGLAAVLVTVYVLFGVKVDPPKKGPTEEEVRRKADEAVKELFGGRAPTDEERRRIEDEVRKMLGRLPPPPPPPPRHGEGHGV